MIKDQYADAKPERKEAKKSYQELQREIPLTELGPVSSINVLGQILKVS